MNDRVVAVLACRAESTRLYGKPLQRVGDRPILDHLIERLRQSARIDEIVLAISDSPSGAAFADFADRRGLRHTVGPEHDVLGRMIRCAESFAARTVVRVTTENPFVYWENLDSLIALQHETAAALSVTLDLPVGAAIEVVALDAWRAVHAEGTDRQRQQAPSEFLLERPDRFRVNRVPAPASVAAPDLRLTVDSPEDLILVRSVWDALHDRAPIIPLASVVSFLRQHPEVAAINAHLRGSYVWHSPRAAAKG